MSYAIPSSLRYDLLPSSIGEEIQKSITYPMTGTNSVNSSTQNFFIINVPKVLNQLLWPLKIENNNIVQHVQLKINVMYHHIFNVGDGMIL